MDRPRPPHHPSPGATTAPDRLLWAGVACFVLLVAGAAWLAPRVVARDLAGQAAGREVLREQR